MSTRNIVRPSGKRKSQFLPPYLGGCPLIAITGDEAYTAAERLKVQAAEYGVRCLDFGWNAWVAPAQYAAILKDIARKFDRPLLHVVGPADMTALADFVIYAPEGVGNRVWLIWPDGHSHSIHLPAFTPSECHVLVGDLLAGEVVLRNTHLARPNVEYAR